MTSPPSKLAFIGLGWAGLGWAGPKPRPPTGPKRPTASPRKGQNARTTSSFTNTLETSHDRHHNSHRDTAPARGDRR